MADAQSSRSFCNNARKAYSAHRQVLLFFKFRLKYRSNYRQLQDLPFFEAESKLYI